MKAMTPEIVTKNYSIVAKMAKPIDVLFLCSIRHRTEETQILISWKLKILLSKTALKC